MQRETVCLTESAGKGDLGNMSKVQMLLSLKKQRVTAANEETFALFEQTIAELEEELFLSKEENKRLQKLLDAVSQPQLRIHRAEVQQLVVVKEELLPDQQEWSTSLDQEDPEPPPHIKLEQEGEQLQELEEADITKSTFTPDPVKSEGDEEKPQSSEPHQRQTEHMETEADGDECRGPEPARNSDPESSLQPKTEDHTEDSSEPDTRDSSEHDTRDSSEHDTRASSEHDTRDSSEPDTEDSSEPDTEDSADWKETREPASGSNSLKNRHESVCDPQRSAKKKPFSCSVCKKAFLCSGDLKRHMRVHTREKPFTCSVCKEAFPQSGHLKRHMRVHTGEKPFTCTVCKKAFSCNGSLKKHMRIHTGDKPFTCTVCKKAFSLSGSLKGHMRIHTGDKPFTCTVCKKAFSLSGSLKTHMRVHTGEKPFTCTVCKKAFSCSGSLKLHMRIHTGEKPFTCSVCKKAFSRSGHLKSHMRIHTGEEK
ncbi:zinc finger protein 583-like [Pseudochaenichthys georgianus]|uniref:zinc finger protein 583-like n=1 Tax=Pseudochaenichthys georgianus TaxID=52239 RepID=UPI0039C27611